MLTRAGIADPLVSDESRGVHSDWLGTAQMPLANDAGDLSISTITKPGRRTLRSIDDSYYRRALAMIFADTNETGLLSELQSMTPSSISAILPPEEKTSAVLAHFFTHFDNLIPLYDESATYHLLEVYYGNPQFQSSDLTAYVYSIIARSYACSEQAIACQETSTSWAFFNHAARYLPELIANEPGLLSIQALLGMVNPPLRSGRDWS